jgi:hypothetical protein
LASSSRELAQVNAEMLPMRRALEAAAKQGGKVTIQDLAGDPYWMLNAIEVWDNTSDPGVQALQDAAAADTQALHVRRHHAGTGREENPRGRSCRPHWHAH